MDGDANERLLTSEATIQGYWGIRFDVVPSSAPSPTQLTSSKQLSASTLLSEIGVMPD